MLDKEILDDFIKQIRSTQLELQDISKELKLDMNKPEHFEKFGLLVDRIYGTASTLGMKNLAKYTMILKEIGYKTAQKKGNAGKPKVIGVIESSATFFDTFCNIVQGIKKTDSLQHTLKLELAKAENLLASILK